MKVEKLLGAHITVTVRAEHRFHGESPWTAFDELRRAEATAQLIRVTLAEMAQEVTVVRERKWVCQYCGYPWTEDSPDFNGGCCSQDEAASPRQPGQSEAK